MYLVYIEFSPRLNIAIAKNECMYIEWIFCCEPSYGRLSLQFLIHANQELNKVISNSSISMFLPNKTNDVIYRIPVFYLRCPQCRHWSPSWWRRCEPFHTLTTQVLVYILLFTTFSLVDMFNAFFVWLSFSDHLNPPHPCHVTPPTLLPPSPLHQFPADFPLLQSASLLATDTAPHAPHPLCYQWSLLPLTLRVAPTPSWRVGPLAKILGYSLLPQLLILLLLPLFFLLMQEYVVTSVFVARTNKRNISD